MYMYSCDYLHVLQVRAAAVFALGTYIFTSSNDGSHSHSDHATSIDHSVAMMLLPLVSDGSPLVRMVCSLFPSLPLSFSHTLSSNF